MNMTTLQLIDLMVARFQSIGGLPGGSARRRLMQLRANVVSSGVASTVVDVPVPDRVVPSESFSKPSPTPSASEAAKPSVKKRPARTKRPRNR